MRLLIIVVGLVAWLPMWASATVVEDYPLQVVKPERLPESLPATISRVAGRYVFKPHIGRLADGEMVMFADHTHPEEIYTSHDVELPSRSLTTHAVIYRSEDEGLKWGRGRHVREMIGGHEPSVTVVDDVLFVITSVHGSGWFPSPYAERDHSYVVIHRSVDGGRTFTNTIFDRAVTGAADDERIDTTRNILQLPDGRLWLGVAVGARHRAVVSDDQGLTWELVETEVKGARYEGVSRGFFGESLLFYTNSGQLMMLVRVDYTHVRFADPLTDDPNYGGGTLTDNFDGEVLFNSPDAGRTWTPVQAIGFPALMYPSIVNLEGNRMLFTYTVREIPPLGTGSIYPHVGLQAIVVEERDDGTLDFDFSRDVIVIDDSTPAAMRNAGGFGNTLQMPDGTFVTPFSYPLIDADILELANRKEYMKEEVYDYWAGLQKTYSDRYKDIVKDDPVLSELHLRRTFSALFLYGQAANKGGIATGVVRWKL
jgi:hypothetical protein